MEQFDSNLTKSLEDFMESYKMVDVEQIYSNGTEFVPIFRVKQWLEYNNINNLQSKIDKLNNENFELAKRINNTKEIVNKVKKVSDYMNGIACDDLLSALEGKKWQS